MGKTKKGTALLLAFTLCASILTPNSVDAAKVKKPVLSKKKLALVRDKSATIRLKSGHIILRLQKRKKLPANSKRSETVPPKSNAR